VGDKCEISPTSRAKCQVCFRKIQQGQERIGKEEFYPQTQGYIHRYYHVACYQKQFPNSNTSNNNTSTLNLPSQRTLAEELEHARQQSATAQRLLRQRTALRTQLQLLRQAFATRLGQPEFLIFPDATLDDLVVKLPRNKEELLHVHGIAETRLRNFGCSILQVIAQHEARGTAAVGAGGRAAAATSRKSSSTTGRVAAPVARKRQRVEQPPVKRTAAVAGLNKEVIAIDDDNDDRMNHHRPHRRPSIRTKAAAAASRTSRQQQQQDNDDIIFIDDTDDGDDDSDSDEEYQDDDSHDDDEEDGLGKANNNDDDDEEDEGEGIVVGKSLTCEEIVQQKFDHAAKNNYIISVD
jgi:hypothetical protein